jgi:hypothetical protein
LAYENEVLPTLICASTNTSTYYITNGTTVTQGNKLYTNSDAWDPAPDGWYRWDDGGSGPVRFQVVNGVMGAQLFC